jgi:hypothetical protein
MMLPARGQHHALPGGEQSRSRLAPAECSTSPICPLTDERSGYRVAASNLSQEEQS